jgi:hypothetical protein
MKARSVVWTIESSSSGSANVVAEAHRGSGRLLARLFSGDDLDEDDQLRLDRMHDDGSFGVGQASGEPRHRKIGRRAPQEGAGADHRLYVPVAGRLDPGVLDDRFHDRGAGSQSRREVVVHGHAGQDFVDG